MPKLFICGDIVNRAKNLNFVDDSLIEILGSVDYGVCNFEGPELQTGQKAACPHQEAGTASYLKKLGFDLFLLANNHITELGKEGVEYTIDTIKSIDGDYVGAGLSWEETYRPLVKRIGNLTFGFVNICEAQVGQFVSREQSFGYAWLGYEGLLDDIRKLANNVDRVVVYVHAGLEHYPIPLPEFRSFYRQLCRAGTSCVIGGHTHTAQGYEFYDGKLIIYSLGNFYLPRSNGAWPEENTSYSVLLDFKEDGNITPIPIHHSLYNNKVILQNDKNKQVDLSSLCDMLQDGYENHANKVCIEAYKKLCSHLLASATCGEYDDMNTSKAIKNAVRNTIFRKRTVISTKTTRRSLLLRLFENESYRFTIIRALKHI